MQPISVTKKVDEIDDAATGAKIRKLREESGLSLRAVALEMAVSAPYLSDLELGRRGWSEERAQQCVDAIKKLSAAPKRDVVPTRRTMK